MPLHFIWLALCAGLVLVESSPLAQDHIPQGALEGDAKRVPLAPFQEALRSLARGERNKVRVLHYGDSHTAADILTTAIRRDLQSRFGNGGRGFVLLGHPWKSYSPMDISVSSSGLWNGKRVDFQTVRTMTGGRFGLSGIASEPSGPECIATIAAPIDSPFSAQMERFELLYLRQPTGGDLLLSMDGQRPQLISTASGGFETGVVRHRLPKGAHAVSVSAVGNGPVRVFGAIVESESPGVVYDTLGVNGGIFEHVLAWDEQLLSAQVAMREPSLLVIMYGTNEASDRKLAPEPFAQTATEAIKRLRRGAPMAACLVIGPPDRRSTVRRRISTERLDWVISVEEGVAKAQGCEFIDARSLMGGPGSFATWQKQGLAAPDGVHLTIKGYTLLGRLIAKQMLRLAL